MPAPRRTTIVIAAVGAACLGPLLGAAPSSGAVRPATAVRAAGSVVPAAVTYRPTAADRRIAGKLEARATYASFGRYFSGTVIDVASNKVVWARYGGTGRMPASTTKLVTATNALNRYGPAHRFTTTVKLGRSWSSLVLVGAGDPSLSSADLTVLAKATAAKVTAQGVKSVRVYADDHLFAAPSLASGWKSSYVPTDVRWVRALVVDGHHANDTSLDAAKVFAGKLKAAGVGVVAVGRATARLGAPLVATVQGDRLDAIVRQMMLVSDNDHAEALHRLVAVKASYPATWTGARLAQRVSLARDGITLPDNALRDGSGLSRSDRLTSTQLARVVDNILESHQSDLAVLRSGGLPVAGRTGTLRASYGRFNTSPSKCAAGRVVAKTGTLSDAVALAGWTRGTDGRLKAFAFLVNYKKADLTLKRRIDALAATVTGCY
jgi:serine-type D-Ala-D-Ala carboxypeptidase/endopeptidase (penicillin-binding protein 4)